MKLYKKKISLREQLKSTKLVRLMGAHDGLTAKLIGEAGFEGVWASGLEISASYGVPDANILTMTQYLAKATEMTDATSIPVIADCDTGYGNVNNAIYMVEQYEKNGIQGICIEDKLFPKVNSFVPGRQELARIDEFCGKIRAIKQNQKKKETFLISRIEALIAGWGMEEAIKRAIAYDNAGTDAILIHSKQKNPGEIYKFIKSFKKISSTPIVIVPTTYPELSEKDIERMGVKIVIYANQLIRSKIKSNKRILEILSKKRKLSSIEKEIEPLGEVFNLSGMNQLKENEKMYLKKANDDVKIVIPAAGIPPVVNENKEKLPISLVKLNGKSVIQRNLETLKSLKFSNISLVTGYKKNLFNNIEVKKIYNPNFKTTTQLDSIMLALNKYNGSLLSVFSDILFEEQILTRILSSNKTITLIIDAIDPKYKYTECDKVIAQYPPKRDGRVLTFHRMNKIKDIGKEIDLKKANYEFIGISYFSKEGLKILKKVYKTLNNKSKKVDFLDAIKFILRKKLCEVSAIEVNGGWIEIKNSHSLNLAKNILSE